jgi:hypothetical protein
MAMDKVGLRSRDYRSGQLKILEQSIDNLSFNFEILGHSSNRGRQPVQTLQVQGVLTCTCNID